MADIFISYSHEDEARVRPLVTALEKEGWSVFWDRRIPSGQTYRGRIGLALEEARCVLAVWSRASVKSDSVIEEAADGRRRGRLVLVRVDAVDPPLGFRENQFIDFSGHELGRRSPRLRSLLDDIKGVLGATATERDTKAEGISRSGPSRRSRAKRQQGGMRPARQVVRVGEVRIPTSGPGAQAFWDNSTGPREIAVPVVFEAPFGRPPSVVVGLRELDLGDVASNVHRISVRPENVRADGFDLYFATWLESQIYGAVASWIAVGS
jgi:hypothetical protein